MGSLKATENCVECGARRFNMRHRCGPCLTAWQAAIRGAVAGLGKAIRSGELPKASALTCVDCGKRAEHWDHRDYRRPTDVQAVCRSCNFKRGPALWRDDKAAA